MRKMVFIIIVITICSSKRQVFRNTADIVINIINNNSVKTIIYKGFDIILICV